MSGWRSKQMVQRGAGWSAALLSVFFAGCSSVPLPPESSASSPSVTVVRSDVPALPRAGSGRGGYYLDDGPGDTMPEGLMEIPNAVPRVEPFLTRGNRPYVVFGKNYTPFTDMRAYKERGHGSWYGKKFHGQRTSSGEIYDMYQMTAAHPTLPLPSYVRVKNTENGREVIVRVNDRGPFIAGRIIDLSYTAALKLGYLQKGSALLEVERLLPADIERINAQAPATRVVASASDTRTQAPIEYAQQRNLTSAAAALAPVIPSNATSNATSSTPQMAALPEVDIAAESVAQVELPSRVALPEMPLAAPSVSPSPMAPVAAGAPDNVSAQAGLQSVSYTSGGAAAANADLVPGMYLQLGAFGQMANAHAARSRLLEQAGAHLPSVQLIEQGGMFRLFSGPFASRSQAEAAASAVARAGAQVPLIVQR